MQAIKGFNRKIISLFCERESSGATIEMSSRRVSAKLMAIENQCNVYLGHEIFTVVVVVVLFLLLLSKQSRLIVI